MSFAAKNSSAPVAYECCIYIFRGPARAWVHNCLATTMSSGKVLLVQRSKFQRKWGLQHYGREQNNRSINKRKRNCLRQYNGCIKFIELSRSTGLLAVY